MGEHSKNGKPTQKMEDYPKDWQIYPEYWQTHSKIWVGFAHIRVELAIIWDNLQFFGSGLPKN